MPTKAPPATPGSAASGDTIEGLRCDIDRGPNWLFVRLLPSQAQPATVQEAKQWAEGFWSICDRHFTYRLVVELDEVSSISEAMTEELKVLGERLEERGGALRLCGMSAACERRVHKSHAELRNHLTRRDAVLSDSAIKPH